MIRPCRKNILFLHTMHCPCYLMSSKRCDVTTHYSIRNHDWNMKLNMSCVKWHNKQKKPFRTYNMEFRFQGLNVVFQTFFQFWRKLTAPPIHIKSTHLCVDWWCLKPAVMCNCWTLQAAVLERLQEPRVAGGELSWWTWKTDFTARCWMCS